MRKGASNVWYINVGKHGLWSDIMLTPLYAGRNTAESYLSISPNFVGAQLRSVSSYLAMPFPTQKDNSPSLRPLVGRKFNSFHWNLLKKINPRSSKILNMPPHCKQRSDQVIISCQTEWFPPPIPAPIPYQQKGVSRKPPNWDPVTRQSSEKRAWQ